MRLTVQQGINTNDLQQAIYETIRAGMECDARAAQKRHQERMDLIRRSGGTLPRHERQEQPSLFDCGEV